MTIATAEYVRITNGIGGRRTSVGEVRLDDEDLIRGDDAGERVIIGSGTELFGGFTTFVQTGFSLSSIVRQQQDSDVRVTVTFDDGSKLSNVLGLRDFGAGSFGSSYDTYLLDVNKLASVGKTLSDVADVRPDAQVSHNLSWADLGFKLDAPAVGPEPPAEPEQPEEPQPPVEPEQPEEPQPPVEPEQPEEPQTPVEPEQPQEPAAIEILGTDARDTLKGTMADEIIIGGDGNDRLLGGGGSDTFVFGADANNGSRNWDVIRDFDLANDTILLEDGAQIRRIIERNDKVIIQLEGDRDHIIVRNQDASIVDNIVFDDIA